MKTTRSILVLSMFAAACGQDATETAHGHGAAASEAVPELRYGTYVGEMTVTSDACNIAGGAGAWGEKYVDWTVVGLVGYDCDQTRGGHTCRREFTTQGRCVVYSTEIITIEIVDPTSMYVTQQTKHEAPACDLAPCYATITGTLER